MLWKLVRAVKGCAHSQVDAWKCRTPLRHLVYCSRRSASDFAGAHIPPGQGFGCPCPLSAMAVPSTPRPLCCAGRWGQQCLLVAYDLKGKGDCGSCRQSLAQAGRYLLSCVCHACAISFNIMCCCACVVDRHGHSLRMCVDCFAVFSILMLGLPPLIPSMQDGECGLLSPSGRDFYVRLLIWCSSLVAPRGRLALVSIPYRLYIYIYMYIYMYVYINIACPCA